MFAGGNILAGLHIKVDYEGGLTYKAIICILQSLPQIKFDPEASTVYTDRKFQVQRKSVHELKKHY